MAIARNVIRYLSPGKAVLSRTRAMPIRVSDTASERGSRAMEARRANDRIAAKAEQLRFVSRVPMLCECGARGCRAIVLLALDDYRKIRGCGGTFFTAQVTTRTEPNSSSGCRTTTFAASPAVTTAPTAAAGLRRRRLAQEA
jgi:hypothetical protein